MNPEANESGAADAYVNTMEKFTTSAAELLKRLAETQESLLAAEDKVRRLEQKCIEQTTELTESNLAYQRNFEALKQSKQRLREREARLNSIFNAAVEGIITIDRNGIVVNANTAVKAILGYAEEELIGRNICMLMPSIHAEEHDQYIRDFIDSRASRIIGNVREVEGLHKEGWTVPIDLSLAQFTIDGKIYFTGILRDTSQRKRQERENREHLEELAHVTRLSLMGEMASGIAHEVNQPLTAIVAYTEVSLNLLQSPKPNTARLVDILTKTHQQALRAGQIIHRMRDFIRTKTSNRTSVNINKLVRDSIGLCANDMKVQNIQLRLELSDHLPVVYANEVQIEQVLLNLIKNAMDAMQELPQDLQRRLRIKTQLDARHGVEILVE
ncbi:MAG: PAS domain S-box protein, partial [Gammaproteobacteria bacterium]